MYACFKAASLTEEARGLLAKNTNHVEELNSTIELLNYTPGWCVAISDYFGNVATEKMARKGRAKRVKSPRAKNKKRFPIGDYKYAMKNVKADYLLECQSLQMEKEKLNAVIVEVSVFR